MSRTIKTALKLSAYFLILSLTSFKAYPQLCPSYDEVAAKLGKVYGEQRLFSGIADKAKRKGANAVYEFWSHPQRGTWSLVAHRLILFKDAGRQIARNCAFIVSSGKRYKRITAAPKTTAPIQGLDSAVSDAGCVAHEHHRQLLSERYDEAPLLRAVTDDEALVEIYTGQQSWTVLQVKSSARLRDRATGQEIRRLCSTPLFSGKSWRLDSVVIQLSAAI